MNNIPRATFGPVPYHDRSTFSVLLGLRFTNCKIHNWIALRQQGGLCTPAVLVFAHTVFALPQFWLVVRSKSFVKVKLVIWQRRTNTSVYIETVTIFSLRKADTTRIDARTVMCLLRNLRNITSR